jgi:serine phosphatase RsbU (regulator of sigma subunit)
VRLDQEPISGRLTVPPGGSLILTAGLIEPRAVTGESFGAEKVRACLSQAGAEPRESLQALLSAAQQSGLAADDEILIVWLKRDPGTPAGTGGPNR